MNKYITTIKAVCPKTNKLKNYHGPVVEGISVADAQMRCDNNGMGYCKVDMISTGFVTDEITDYDNYKSN
ncbi:hypothetical protein [Mucilaginibacter sp.]|jgi:hypothetical protein|uniref:hypothetical protein n=1 Tax=Mucilaginibacter sp. TaxID=1882438 RepID=UPI00356158AC